VVSGSTGLVLDEAYYTVWSFHPSAGYLDHPPAVAWMIALGRAVAGDSELGVRLLSVMTGIAVAAALYRTGRILFDARTAALGTIWYTLSVVAALGFITTPDTPSVLFWTLTVWAVAEFAGSRNPYWWLAVGLFAGLGLTGKLTNGFLGIGLVLYLLSSAERRSWLRLWQVWAGALVALAAFSPVLLWNAQHGWVTFLFQGQRITGGAYLTAGFWANFGELVGGQALAAGPILLVCAVIALGMAAWQRFRHEGLGLIVLTSLPLLIYMLYHAISWKVEANWLTPVWPVVSLAAAWVVLQWRPEGGIAGGVAAFLRWGQPALGAVLIALIFAQALFQPFTIPTIDRTQEMRGWREFDRTIRGLADAYGARWIAGAGGYGVISELATYGHFAGSPLPALQLDQRERYAFLPPLEPEALGWPMLYVEEVWAPEVPGIDRFAAGEYLGVIERRHGTEMLGRYAVWVVRSPDATFQAMTGG
jgi:4-amino-4-deoxy-L-arabinose transferase-like glycosyltransferase